MSFWTRVVPILANYAMVQRRLDTIKEEEGEVAPEVRGGGSGRRGVKALLPPVCSSLHLRPGSSWVTRLMRSVVR